VKKIWPWLGVAALLAVIAAIVLPSYADYTHRAQASEAIMLLAGAKTPLAEHFADKGQWPPSLQALKLDTSGKFTREVVISKGAGGKGEIELTATMRVEGVDRRVAGKSVRLLSRDGGATWLCRPGTLESSNLPLDCRPPGQ
jgi:type IV pilus assembly protein PilA